MSPSQTINRSFTSAAVAEHHRQARLSSRRRPAAPLGSAQLESRSSQPGRLWVRRGLGPPSQGAAAVHTTPIAVPISVRIGEPDISLRMRSAAWVIHSGPPKWRILEENHRRPSRDNSRAG